MTDIEILVKNAYKAGYACAVDKTEEWLNDKLFLAGLKMKKRKSLLSNI